MEWIDMAQGGIWMDLVNAVMNLRGPIKLGEFLDWGPVSFPTRTLLHAVNKLVS